MNPEVSQADTTHNAQKGSPTMSETADNQTKAQILPFDPKDRQMLTAQDRCDRCAAQAFVEVQLLGDNPPSPLLFCAHHAKEHWSYILTLDCLVQDERPRLETPDKLAAPA